MRTKIINDFTEGPLFRRLLIFSLPFMFSNALQILYNVADMVIVGQYLGKEALAAVAISSQCQAFLSMLCVGFCTGGQIYLAQLIGAGERQRLNAAIGTIFSTIALMGGVVSGLSLAFTGPWLRLMNTPEVSWTAAFQYMTVCCSGLIFTYGYNMLASVLRGMGDSRHPFLFILLASVLNLVLDWIFVAVFHWGVIGAAVATLLGQAISMLLCIAFLYRNRKEFYFDFKLSSFAFHLDVMRKLFKLGIPMALRFGTINISMMFVMSMVSSVGADAAAVFGIGGKLDDTANKVAQGVMQALTAVVGQNYGAGKFQRIRRAVCYTWIITVGIYIVYTLCLVCRTRGMFGLFTDDAQVLALAPVFVSAILWHFPALLILKGTSGFINGIGNAWLGFILSIFDGFVLRILCTWLLGDVMQMGLYGYFLGFAVAGYGMALPSLFYFLFCPWEKRKTVVA